MKSQKRNSIISTYPDVPPHDGDGVPFAGFVTVGVGVTGAVVAGVVFTGVGVDGVGVAGVGVDGEAGVEDEDVG